MFGGTNTRSRLHEEVYRLVLDRLDVEIIRSAGLAERQLQV